MSLTSHISTDLTELRSQQHQWAALHAADSQATFFSQPHFQLAWWQHLQPAGSSLAIITIVNEVGEWQACLPLYLDPAKNQAALIGGLDESDYLDLLMSDQADTANCLDLLVAALDQLGCQSLHLVSLRPQSRILTQLLPKLSSWHQTQTQQTVCPVITLPKTVEAYTELIEPNLLKSLKRSWLEVGDEGEVTVEVLTQPAQMELGSQRFIQLHQQSSTAKSAFWTPKRKAFFADIVTSTAELDQLKLVFLKIDGDPAAALLIFDYRDQFLLYNSGFNAFRYGHLRVGNLLVQRTIEQAITLGRQRYDFMRGDEAYKFQFGAVAEPLLNVTATKT